MFGVFSITYPGESLKWNHAGAFLFIVGAVFLMFYHLNEKFTRMLTQVATGRPSFLPGANFHFLTASIAF